MTLEDLIGPHILTAVEHGDAPELRRSPYDGIPNTFMFTLDGTTYRAVEDPDDDYRSSMEDIDVLSLQLRNVFEPIAVEGRMKASFNGNQNDVLELVNSKGNVILAVGTENTDDYYPCWVANWSPELIDGAK